MRNTLEVLLKLFYSILLQESYPIFLIKLLISWILCQVWISISFELWNRAKPFIILNIVINWDRCTDNPAFAAVFYFLQVIHYRGSKA